MLDPAKQMVLVTQRDAAPDVGMRDVTAEVESCEVGEGKVHVRFASRPRVYPYSHPNARFLVEIGVLEVGADEVVMVEGEVIDPSTVVTEFADVLDHNFRRFRVVWPKEEKRRSRVCEPRQLCREPRVETSSGPRKTWRYLQDVVGCLDADDYVRTIYSGIKVVHPHSALTAYLKGENSRTDFPEQPVILPFNSNLDQLEAITNALHNQVSVIEGPPGTGKTETILNLVANILMAGDKSVAVVSFNNAAVDNVVDKLNEVGIGFVSARLGKRALVEKFFDGQEGRNGDLGAWLEAHCSVEQQDPSRPEEQLSAAERGLADVWRTTRNLAEVCRLREAYQLELAHFERNNHVDETPDLGGVPLLRKNSEKILDFLAESAVSPPPSPGLSGLVPRLWRYLRYGSLRNIDPQDNATALRLEHAYYLRRISELQAEEETLLQKLTAAKADAVRYRHQQLSRDALSRALQERYRRPNPPLFDARHDTRSRDFLPEYPVVLTTCHAIRNNLGSRLVDWLIIDEATQTNIPVAAAAMSCARNAVIVGDLEQLGHILHPAPGQEFPDPPRPSVDVDTHSILSSVTEVYGKELPQTLLREHYRCVPAIIDFCNQMFYGGQLIPMKPPSVAQQPAMLLLKTAPGNHQRTLTQGPVRGHYNQREIDEILSLVGKLASLPNDDDSTEIYSEGDRNIGCTTPYRLQADRLKQAFSSAEDQRPVSDTVHKFQGRGVDVMVFSTVIDNSVQGRRGRRFVDDPRLVNVAVSRAKERFVLVTNHNEIPGTKVLRTLIDYIRYLDPEAEEQGQIISVFDLLYQEYSSKLHAFAQRLHGGSKFRSENIVWTLLNQVLSEPKYQLFRVAAQVPTRSLLPDVAHLDEEQRRFLRTRTAVDFAVYHRVSKVPAFVVEVQGFAFHENNPAQQDRDATKLAILSAYGIRCLKLKTNHSGEEERIRDYLDQFRNHMDAILAGNSGDGVPWGISS